MRQMADRLMEIVKEKGLAERNQALFINSAERAEKAWKGADDPETMSAGEKRAMFGDMDVVMAGFAGLHGSVILARDSSEKLRSRYPASFLEKAKGQERQIWQIPEAAPAGKSDDCSAYSFSEKGITGMYLLSKGGVFAGLWNLAKAAGVGLKIDLKSIPIRQETENNDRVVINGEERRYLEKHYEDALELVSRKEQS